jgi:hypothetical protein
MNQLAPFTEMSPPQIGDNTGRVEESLIVWRLAEPVVS